MSDASGPILDTKTGTAPPASVDFHARGFLGHAIAGLGLGSTSLWAGYALLSESLTKYPPGDDLVKLALMSIFPSFLAFIGAFMIWIGAVHIVRKIRKPLAFRMDQKGVEGFLVFGRRRIAWRDITNVNYQGAWIHLVAGRKTIFINPSQLKAKGGHDPAKLIDYFLNGVLNPGSAGR